MNVNVLGKIQHTIALESDQFTNNPLDKGGPTKFGVTQATYNAAGYAGSVENCTYAQAVQIYTSTFWTKPGFDMVDTVDSTLSTRLFDWGVTSGPSTSSKALQRVLNVLNRNGTDYPDIAVDGIVGTGTIGALQRLYTQRGIDGARVCRGMVQSLQSVFYIQVAENNPSQEAFEFGWQVNRAFGA